MKNKPKTNPNKPKTKPNLFHVAFSVLRFASDEGRATSGVLKYAKRTQLSERLANYKCLQNKELQKFITELAKKNKPKRTQNEPKLKMQK